MSEEHFANVCGFCDHPVTWKKGEIHECEDMRRFYDVVNGKSAVREPTPGYAWPLPSLLVIPPGASESKRGEAVSLSRLQSEWDKLEKMDEEYFANTCGFCADPVDWKKGEQHECEETRHCFQG